MRIATSPPSHCPRCNAAWQLRSEDSASYRCGARTNGGRLTLACYGRRLRTARPVPGLRALVGRFGGDARVVDIMEARHA